MRRRRQAAADEAEVDMTPMLDVVFILLIFFIVTSVFLNEKGLDLTPPPPAPPNENKETTPVVQIYIDANNRIEVDRRTTDVGNIRANIARRKAQEPNVAVIVLASPSAKNKFVLEAVDQAKQADVPVNIVAASE